MGGYFQVRGGERLEGKVCLHGAKNAVLPLLALGIMTDEDVVVCDCPNISDVDKMTTMLTNLGLCVRKSARDIRVSGRVHSVNVCDTLAKDMRSSMFMLGALLSRYKQVDLTVPGGCSIGARPLDIHLDGMRKMGAQIKTDGDVIHCFADKLYGADIVMRYPSVGATENLIMCGALAIGHTTLINCAREPEILSLVQGLRKMGARISGEGSSVINIDGVDTLGGCTIVPVNDRIVAGTLMCAVANCGGSVFIDGGDVFVLRSLVDVLKSKDCTITGDEHHICIRATGRAHACNITTAPYPLFPTDLQPQILAYSCFADGVSVIRETVFENRFAHAFELKKLGCEISVCDNRVARIVGCNTEKFGAKRIVANQMFARDLRGGAGLLIAAMNIKDESKIFNVEYVDRGYENFENTLCSIGAHVIRK